MGGTGIPAAAAATVVDNDFETALLLHDYTAGKPPKDPFHFTCISYFILGIGCLLPWNAFITAVDYFSYIYPNTHVDRVFSVAYIFVALLCLLVVVFHTHKSDARLRINLGLVLLVLCLLAVPGLDLLYIQGRVGLYGGFYVTVGAIVVCGGADALLQGSMVGCAGELPDKYMQSFVSGTAGSGVIVSVLRIVTKAIYLQDARGLRQSANLYFAVGIAVGILCIVLYNVTANLPVMKHYTNMKNQEKQMKGPPFGSMTRSKVWEITKMIKIYATGLVLVLMVTLSIFPGYITEDVKSAIFGDWYPTLLITGYNLGDLFGKLLSSVYLIHDPKLAFGGCVSRLLFFPLFLGCLHGPRFFRTEIPVVILTCLLGLTNGYFTAVMMIFAPKMVAFEHSEVAGVLLVLFLFVGLAIGSLLAWVWII